MKYLGIDYGEKRIGLALGDSETSMAMPFKVVNNIDEIEQIIKEENVDAIVLGEPIKMQNTPKFFSNKMQNKFLEFLELLKKKVCVPIELVDERLSSKEADSLIGNKKTKAPRDAVAAMLILQTRLDQLR